MPDGTQLYDVVLAVTGKTHIQVIKEILGLTSVNLLTAKEMTERLPAMVLSRVEATVAATARQLLEGAGATVDVVPTGTVDVAAPPTQKLHPAFDAVLSQNLIPGEVVRVVIRGAGTSALVGTETRAFIMKKGLLAGATFGAKVTTWEYANLAGVQLETTLMTAVLTLQAPGVESVDTSYWKSGKSDPWKAPHALPIADKRAAEAGVALLRTLIAKSRESAPLPQPPQADPVEQIRRLGELREAGVLTEKEFEEKKRDLLGRI